MRSQEEMLETILKFSKNDARVKAVILSGSRADHSIKKDEYQDFDIVFMVEETESFLLSKDWLSAFGEIAVMQEPYSREFGWGGDHDDKQSYTWLMLFTDGNRIDLSVRTLPDALKEYDKEAFSIVLLDKENILPKKSRQSHKRHFILPPTRPTFDGCCNEFWWCLNNVAKGIVRGQMPYAHKMYYFTVHSELEKMTEWLIGLEHDFCVSGGKWGKFYQKYLSKDLYEEFAATYCTSPNENIWQAVFAACKLFSKMAVRIAERFGYVYSITQEQNMLLYLRRIQAQDALNLRGSS